MIVRQPRGDDQSGGLVQTSHRFQHVPPGSVRQIALANNHPHGANGARCDGSQYRCTDVDRQGSFARNLPSTDSIGTHADFFVQYTMYDKFNGLKDNFDGTDRNASDNNTLYTGIWFAF
jgi:hypothetical protein